MAELRIFLCERLGKSKPTYSHTIQVDKRTPPPATIEVDGVIYEWRFTDCGIRQATYAAVI